LEDSSVVKVMVVDDSAVVRGLWTKLLQRHADIRVVATAENGRVALDTLRRRDVDVVVLDIEMPEMDGLTAIPLILGIAPQVKILLASTFTRAGSESTVKGLTLGAADFVTKPTSGSMAQGLEIIAGELAGKVRALKRARASGAAKVALPCRPATRSQGIRAIAIGSSTGGPNALAEVLNSLPRELTVPILLVQHIPQDFTQHLADRLAKVAGRPCRIPADGDPVTEGTIYLAGGGQHMAVEARGLKVHVKQLDSPPENFCKPAVDPLFESAAGVYGQALLAVVLTGMGEDGRRGAEAVVKHEGLVLAQDEDSSVVWGMPGAVAKAGLASQVLPLKRMQSEILNLCLGDQRAVHEQ
jgi:two-component system chemotaxis response regulator CheB